MFTKLTLFLLLFFSAIVFAGCHILIAEQEWSNNYALLEGALSTNPEMIDGDYKTVGESRSSAGGPGRIYGSSNATEVIVTLPEKKNVRRIVIHSENIKKFALYADRGGTLHSDTDWQLIHEQKMVKTDPVVVPIFGAPSTARYRLVVLDTSDDAGKARLANAEISRAFDQFDRNPEGSGVEFSRALRNYRRHYPARISEIEFYGYKSAEETAASDPVEERETELDLILK